MLSSSLPSKHCRESVVGYLFLPYVDFVATCLLELECTACMQLGKVSQVLLNSSA